MSDFDILRDLIRDDALATVEYPYGKKIIVLKEPGDQQRPEYSLKLRNVPDDLIVFKADAFPPPKSIFKDSKNECKRADFVIIAGDNRGQLDCLHRNEIWQRSFEKRNQATVTWCTMPCCLLPWPLVRNSGKSRDFLKKRTTNSVLSASKISGYQNDKHN